ncbi:helix-turn-helix transcriptional regulator [Flavobacterium sp. SUN046]|uniref:helix-turn-helix transcriptional regulator n=1 Tax=Flavobacterium sp. SUN046 TaxID=3002440 RepID=UPI002DBB6C78|nr:helix-turn-helix transcriptional regulator [Flavobacterium sp. SUN046]MEC4048669.1 helix-turn-helix transcriptional regulator [Flavobacterium sp. SUN046]
MTSRVIKNIRTIRIEKNYSQEYMSLELKISQSYYGRIENGKCKLDLKLLFRIADVLEINFENLFKEDLKVLIKEEKMLKKSGLSQKLVDQYELRISDLKQEINELKEKLKRFERFF